MKVKFLKDIVEILISKQAVPIIDLLAGKKDVNEFAIAKKLGLTINQTRNILYKLSDYGLVSFIRKKDKKKGWYIYFWTLNIYQSLNLLEQNLKKELDEREMQLKNRIEKRYYICNTCSIEVSEDSALLNDFTCPECGEVYVLSENRESIEKLEKEISKIKKEITLVVSEKDKEGEKLEKKKARKIKRQEKEKKAIRAEARKNRSKENMKKVSNKKDSKKKPKKKPKKKTSLKNNKAKRKHSKKG
jgi:transcription factor E